MSLDHDTDFVKHQTPRVDAFLGGRLQVAQPVDGFRAGLDSVLLGAAVRPLATSLLDLGAGAGTASLVALADRPALAATLAERDPALVAFAVTNLAANGFAKRAAVLTIDVTATGRLRSEVGLAANHYETVIANPPFYATGNGTAASASRQGARQMPADALDQWAKAAATHAAPGGEVIFIHLAERLAHLLAAFDSRFGALTVLPLLPRANAPAHRLLVRGIKGSRAPLILLASRPLHPENGSGFSPEFERIFRGEDRLHW